MATCNLNVQARNRNNVLQFVNLHNGTILQDDELNNWSNIVIEFENSDIAMELVFRNSMQSWDEFKNKPTT